MKTYRMLLALVVWTVLLTACNQPQDWRKEAGMLDFREGKAAVFVAFLQAVKAKDIRIERPKSWISTKDGLLTIQITDSKRLKYGDLDSWKLQLQPLADAFWTCQSKTSAIVQIDLVLIQEGEYETFSYYATGKEKFIHNDLELSGVDAFDFYQEGLAFMEDGEYDSAKESFVAGVNSDDTYAMNYVGLIDLQIETYEYLAEDFVDGTADYWKEAETWLSIIKEKLELDPEVYLAESRLALAKAEFDRSLEALNTVESLNRFHSDLFDQRIQTYLAKGDTTQACYYLSGARKLQMSFDYYEYMLENKCPESEE